MHCLASPRRQCVSIRLFLETDRRCPDCPSAPSDAPTIASSPVSATDRIRRVDFITWRRRRYRLCTLWERPTQFPFRSSKTQFGYKFISLRPRDCRARRKCGHADLLISATVRRPRSLVTIRPPRHGLVIMSFIFLFRQCCMVPARCSCFIVGSLLLLPGMWAKYCDQHACMYVCLSQKPCIQISQNFLYTSLGPYRCVFWWLR